MTIKVYQKGDMVRVTGVFTDLLGALIDPTSTSFKATKPSGSLLSYTYPTTIVRDSLGNFHIDVSVDEVGTWYYRWESTGVGQASEPAEFVVTGV
jgi:hypothetical protein